MIQSPYYPRVPKDLQGNLRYREEIVKLGVSSESARKQLWAACSRDLLFWINTFVWTFNPKKPEHPKIPLNTWPFQDKALLIIQDATGKYDIFSDKSREMGATWMYCLDFLHFWLFRDTLSFLMISRTEDYVDKTGNPKCLFWKLDFAIKHMPGWLLPNMTRQKLHLANEDNGSVIDGESTTGEAGRGDRRTAVLVDEYAAFKLDDGYKVLRSLRDVTDSRFFNATPQGGMGAFSDLHDRALLGKIKHLPLPWVEHPEKAAGMYTFRDDKLEILDKTYSFPANFNFRRYDLDGNPLNGRPRSPQYDKEEDRCAHPQELAQEWDMNYLGSSFQYFVKVNLEDYKKEYCRPAYLRGDLKFDPEVCKPEKFEESPTGDLRLWLHLDNEEKPGPPTDRDYILTVDIGLGTGASNSVISVGDIQSGRKVAEYASAHIASYELAKIAAAMGRWFHGLQPDEAFIAWEANGEGRTFGKAFMELNYGNIYYRRNEQSETKRISDIPGWWTSKELKREVFGNYVKALAMGTFINPSKEAIDECQFYILLPDGRVEHSKAMASQDPTGASANHGDRVIADVLLNHFMQERIQAIRKKPKVAPLGSFGWRREQRKREKELEKVETW